MSTQTDLQVAFDPIPDAEPAAEDPIATTLPRRQASAGTLARRPVPANPLRSVLEGARFLGGVYDVGYGRWTVVTTDTDKERCGGIPLHAFLLATRISPQELEQDNYTDDEIILLRVGGNARLPNENDLVSIRLSAIQDAARDQYLDPTTKSEVEKSALDCEVLGTFYPATTPGGRACLQWGSDLDTTYAGVNYFVYRPGPEALSFIASYPELTEKEIDSGVVAPTVALGKVRFASTRRRSQAAGLADAEVRVRVTDFISRKTAVLGMTRVGKSNTNKIICTAIFEYSRRNNKTIGQIIFDPQGEYANVNQQDETALRLLGEEWVKIYKMGPDPTSAQEKPLTYDFYEPGNVEIAHQFCCQAIDQGGTANAAYTKGFLAASMTPPDPNAPAQEKDEHDRGLFAFYAILAQAGLAIPQGWQGITFRMAGKLANAILTDYPSALRITSTKHGTVTVDTGQGLVDTMKRVCGGVEALKGANGNTLDPPYSGLEKELESWARDDKTFGQIREVFQMKGVPTAAQKRIAEVREYHSPNATGKVEQHILEDLKQGRIVIVDLSVGKDTVVSLMSDRIASAILDNANRLFRENEQAMHVQILVEEAHRLFPRQGSPNNGAKDSPWVRLAKEAAKYELGLQYSTQEVSSIDNEILSQTSNWVIAHLNSDIETGRLAHYKRFKEFAEELQNIDDVGFVRMQTLSGHYIVPVQISKFDHEMINRARGAAGLPPVTPDGQATDRQTTDWDDSFVDDLALRNWDQEF